MWLAIHDGTIILEVSLHKEMTKLISVRGRTLQLEHRLLNHPLVTLTACLFSFVVGEHEIPGMKLDHQVPAATLIATVDGKYC